MEDSIVMKCAVRVLFFGFLASSSVTVAAQTPAPPPAPAEVPPRFEASAQFAFLATTGNASTNTIGAGGEFVWRPDPMTYNGKLVFAQNESDDVVSARSFAGLFRSSRKINERLSAYGQYDFLRDTFAGVEQRHIIEGGVSYLAIDRAPHRLRLDAGLGYLYEDGPEDEHFDSVTLSLGALYRAEISETSEFSFEPRFILPLVDAGAYRYDQVAALNLGINSFLSLKLSHTIRYSAEPPVGFDTTDTITAVSIVARLKRPQ
jgi:putative salt-induced outer membrane protein YdiY